MVGQTIGKYRVVSRLGRGGMGTVYKAVDETLQREVAIKCLNGDLTESEVLKRFRAEAMTLARLNHPNIAMLFELAEHDGQLLMVMELVQGETFDKVSERLGPLSVPRAVELCTHVLDALSHAHKVGIVHRDLKPANLMLADSGVVKVMDFGLARMQGTEHLTSDGFMIGTPAYMSPEQVLGTEVDGRADLYAMGGCLLPAAHRPAAVQGGQRHRDGAQTNVTTRRRRSGSCGWNCPSVVRGPLHARAREVTRRPFPDGGRDEIRADDDQHHGRYGHHSDAHLARDAAPVSSVAPWATPVTPVYARSAAARGRADSVAFGDARADHGETCAPKKDADCGIRRRRRRPGRDPGVNLRVARPQRRAADRQSSAGPGRGRTRGDRRKRCSAPAGCGSVHGVGIRTRIVVCAGSADRSHTAAGLVRSGHARQAGYGEDCRRRTPDRAAGRRRRASGPAPPAAAPAPVPATPALPDGDVQPPEISAVSRTASRAIAMQSCGSTRMGSVCSRGSQRCRRRRTPK